MKTRNKILLYRKKAVVHLVHRYHNTPTASTATTQRENRSTRRAPCAVFSNNNQQQPISITVAPTATTQNKDLSKPHVPRAGLFINNNQQQPGTKQNKLNHTSCTLRSSSNNNHHAAQKHIHPYRQHSRVRVSGIYDLFTWQRKIK